MSDTTPTLALPYLMPSQAQKHVTHNEALERLDALVQLRVAQFGAETPPEDPILGEAYALGSAPSGVWDGQSNKLAIWQGDAWLFLAPLTGWRAWGLAEAELRIWEGSSWQKPTCETQNLAFLGINATADTNNPLLVSGPAALFTHAGAGHQLKVNKASSGDTASLLFQSNWSGRAEMGLAGNNDFAIKVSDTGSSWTEALRVEAASGNLGIGTSTPAAQLEIAGGSQDYLRASDGSGAVFRLAADGNGYCDGAWSGGGADYAEWFEWADGNPGGEDRRGIAVVLEAEKIRPAAAGEDPIGVVSANPCLVGDGDMGHWKDKYLRDDLGDCIWEDNAEGKQTPSQRRLNPAFDPARDYSPRSARPEWSMIGLVGKLRLRRGQPAADRWIRMRRVSAEVEEWLLR